MRTLTLSGVMLISLGCSGDAVGRAGPATLSPAQVEGCPGACDRVAQCWQAQYGQADASGDRAECMERCEARGADEQKSYASAVGAATECTAILDL